MTNLLTLITPTNLEAEKEKFFASSTYHPTFHYIWQDQELAPSFSISRKYPLWEAMRIQDHAAIVHTASELFEVSLQSDILAKAKTLAQVTGRPESGSAEEYATLLRAGLDFFGLRDITIEISPAAGFNARPDHQGKKVIVSRHIHFEYFSMEGGVHHELVHALRYRNGKSNGIRRSQRFLPTEEGLASWCQDYTNDDNGLAQHAMEYVALAVGLEGSLRDIYEVIRGYGMSAELAWKRAARHKFGFIDTHLPGDILKPAMYFANELKIDQLSTADRVHLFVGKINQDELSEYPTYTGLWSADQLVTYFHL
jgi:hypothetical protein